MNKLMLATSFVALLSAPTLAAEDATETWYGGAACIPIQQLIAEQGTWPASLPLPKTPEDLIRMSGGSLSMQMDYGIYKVLLTNENKLIVFTTDKEGCPAIQNMLMRVGPMLNKH